MANKTIKIEPIKETTFEITIEGDGDLILHGRPRQYSLSEIWRQSNPKGSDMPTQFKQPRNLWEERITAIHWEKPIEFHDEDISLYSEEEWNRYMKENRPCFLPSAFYKSFAEAFITFFKEGTGKKGTDFRRSINMHGKIYPVNSYRGQFDSNKSTCYNNSTWNLQYFQRMGMYNLIKQCGYRISTRNSFTGCRCNWKIYWNRNTEIKWFWQIPH